jgi:hypothetical protein
MHCFHLDPYAGCRRSQSDWLPGGYCTAAGKIALSSLLFADPIINALIGGVLQLHTAFRDVQRQT